MSINFDHDPKVIAREGLVFKPDEGIEYLEKKHAPGLPAGTGERRIVAAPPTGARLVGVHALRLKPGQESVLHSHPLSEEVVVCVKGISEVTLGDKILGTGSGKTKRTAEMEAARSAWEKLKTG